MSTSFKAIMVGATLAAASMSGSTPAAARLAVTDEGSGVTTCSSPSEDEYSYENGYSYTDPDGLYADHSGAGTAGQNRDCGDWWCQWDR